MGTSCHMYIPCNGGLHKDLHLGVPGFPTQSWPGRVGDTVGEACRSVKPSRSGNSEESPDILTFWVKHQRSQKYQPDIAEQSYQLCADFLHHFTTVEPPEAFCFASPLVAAEALAQPVYRVPIGPCTLPQITRCVYGSLSFNYRKSLMNMYMHLYIYMYMYMCV